MLSAPADSGRSSLPTQDINNQPRRVEAIPDPDEERGFMRSRDSSNVELRNTREC
jgi:hypothetical protein